jgi:hypothetical protein
MMLTAEQKIQEGSKRLFVPTSLPSSVHTIATRHVAINEHIDYVWAVGDYLIEQFHALKGSKTNRQKNIRFTEAETKSTYHNILFLKRKGRSSMDLFPSRMRCDLEEVMYKDMLKVHRDEKEQLRDFMLVYYNNHHTDDSSAVPNANKDREAWGRAENWKCSRCDEKECPAQFPILSWQDRTETWSLDNGMAMTQSDRLVIAKYRTMLLDLFQFVLKTLKDGGRSTGIGSSYAKINKEYTRIATKCSVWNIDH